MNAVSEGNKSNSYLNSDDDIDNTEFDNFTDFYNNGLNCDTYFAFAENAIL